MGIDESCFRPINVTHVSQGIQNAKNLLICFGGTPLHCGTELTHTSLYARNLARGHVEAVAQLFLFFFVMDL
jgi:hypothetical protein